MERLPFYLTKRKLPSGKKVYYYYYYDNNGNRTVPKTTGETNKQKAFNFCMKLFNAHNLDKKILLFSEYAEGWFTTECQWYKDRTAIRQVKHTTLRTFATSLKKNILPFFKDMDISQINTSHIKDFRVWLLEERKVSKSSVNQSVSVMKIMMDYAVDSKLIPENPINRRIKAFDTEKNREAFTIEEIKFLLSQEWDYYGHWLFTLSGAILGMRFSEILGLQLHQLHDDYIDVCQQYVAGRITSVKTNQSRFVTCPKKLIDMMKSFCDGRDFIFYNKDDAFTPFYPVAYRVKLYSHYNNEMKERYERVNLTFHSFRHFFNTYLIFKGVQESKINFIIGHSTKKGSMFNLYTTWKPEMYADVLKIQEDLLKEILK